MTTPSRIHSIGCRTLRQPHPRRPRITDTALLKRRRCYALLPSFLDSFFPLPSFSRSQFRPIHVFLPCLLPPITPCVRPSVFPRVVPSVPRSFHPLFLDSLCASVLPSSFLPPSFLPCLIPSFRHAFLLAYRLSALAWFTPPATPFPVRPLVRVFEQFDSSFVRSSFTRHCVRSFVCLRVRVFVDVLVCWWSCVVACLTGWSLVRLSVRRYVRLTRASSVRSFIL